jgi:hypothetical protein
MATLNQIRGMLLEEALLCLLRAAGYVTVEQKGVDPTLATGKAGLEVLGRGGRHQIDAIADSQLRLPFVHPQRLLLEAKCLATDRRVGIDVVRNAVGVWKDVSEWWVPVQQTTFHKSRYHYCYAVASASGFSVDAERYAFAQDIFLIPLARTRTMAAVLDPIRRLSARALGADRSDDIRVDLGELRRTIRARLRGSPGEVALTWAQPEIEEVYLACRAIGGVLVAVAPGGFSVLLVPVGTEVIPSLQARQRVRITWNEFGWTLRDTGGTALFNFDLPEELFRLYAESGMLTASAALDLKQTQLARLVATRQVDGRLELVHLDLDEEWITQLREQGDASSPVL